MKLPFFRRRSSKVKSLIAGIVLLGAAGLFVQAKNSDSFFDISKNLDLFASVYKNLNAFYVDPVEPGQLIKTGIDAMLDELDPYTTYITESDIEEYRFQTTGKYGGIGATMKLRGDFIYIGDIFENSPAQMAGLHPGDQLLMINNQDVSGKTLEEVSILLKGAPGTQVSVKIKDAYSGQPVQKSITRGKIAMSSVPYAGLVGPEKKLAFVKLTQFTPHCAREVRSVLDSLKKEAGQLEGVVLDLRSNPGGLLSEAVAICNIFIPKGQLVVSTKGKGKENNHIYETQGSAWDENIPVTVLVNRASASASEIVSGTLQDLDRGIVVGERTYGKGLVQKTLPLGYNAILKLTVARYYTPSGRCIQAINYSNRNPNGTASATPDSLKMAYETRMGRKVWSGGGVLPDVIVPDQPSSKIAIALFANNFIFDFATEYAKTHASIAPPREFALSDTEFNDFREWLKGKDYAYHSETEIVLDSLKSAAKREKHFNAIEKELEQLQKKLAHNKQQDLLTHQQEVRRLLENEIVSRYYFQQGRISHSLNSDHNLEKAVSLLRDASAYKNIFQPE